MTLEELKNYPNGVCLGYSSIEYLYKNKQELLDSYTVNFMKNCDFTKFRLFPNLLYPFLYGCKDKICCRIKIKTKKGFENVGIIWKIDKNLELSSVGYVAKLNTFSPDYDIDSLYEIKNEVQ